MFDDLPCFPSVRTVLLPSKEIVPVTRALVKDSWLSWLDALPPDDGSWCDMDEDVVSNITELAAALSKLHRSMSNYKKCDESPFKVTRWWDPTADDDWDTGRFCLFKFEGLTAIELLNLLPRQSPLTLAPVSPKAPQWVEANIGQLQLIPTDDAGFGLSLASS